MEVRPNIDRFLHHLDVERNFSAQSLRAYAYDLRQFEEFLAARGNADLAAVDHLGLLAYLAQMGERNYERRSIARKLASVRSLFRWLHTRG
jgi:site-specific recombinase XerD